MYSKEYRETHREEKAKIDRLYREANKEKIAKRKKEARLSDPSKQAARSQRWKRIHKDRVNESTNRRRAYARSLAHDFSKEDWLIALDYFEYCCAYCGKPLTQKKYSTAYEHFIPQSLGGGFTATNIVPACHGKGGCNHSKGVQEPLEWLRDKFGKKQGEVIHEKVLNYFRYVKELKDAISERSHVEASL